MARHEIIDVNDRVSPLKAIPLGLQHMMSMFGAAVLVPLLCGMHPSLAIMCSGIGTICYLLITKNKIPSYLGGSFAFISPIVIIGASEGIESALSGIIAAGVIFIIVALIIKFIGTDWMDRVLPPALVASVIIVIGMGLSVTAAKMALYGGGDAFSAPSMIVAGITLFSAILFSSLPGSISTMPVLLAIVIGYVSAYAMGMIDTSIISEADWIGLPQMIYPKFSMQAIILIAPLAFVVIIEHIGHLLTVGEVVGRDYKDDLPRSLAGDGVATIIAGCVGAPPTTTYAENIGVMSVTKVYSTQVFWYASAIALVVGGFIPKVEAIIESIPVPVMGGVSLLLFGLIASNGLRMLVTNKVDFSDNRNLMIVSVVLVLGVGMECAGMAIPVGAYQIPGMATSAITGIILNLIMPQRKVEVEEEVTDL